MHRRLYWWMIGKLGITTYTAAWLGFFKGLLLGYILSIYL